MGYHVSAGLGGQVIELDGCDEVMDSLLDFLDDEVQVDVFQVESEAESLDSFADDGDVKWFMFAAPDDYPESVFSLQIHKMFMKCH